jgi:peptide/nickel transport system substrate-binding protein
MLTRRAALAVTTAVAVAPFAKAFAATPKDVVVMAKQIDDIISLDPQESFEFSGNEIGGNVYQRLVRPAVANPDKLSGDLAQKWDISPDGLTFTFTLKTGPKFASGAPVTAEDVVFSLHRAVILNKTPGFIITQFGYSKDNVEKLIRADGGKVVMTLPETQAPSFVLYCLSANVGGVVEKKAALANARDNDMGNAWLKTNSAGSGPYQVKSWKASEAVSLEVNPNSTVKPHAKRLIIRHIPDPSAQLLSLQKGDIDIARNLETEQLRAIAGTKEFTPVASAKASSMYLAMNQTHPALARPEVRQAVKYAIDYAAIQKNIVPNTWLVDQAFLPKGLPAALTDLPFEKLVGKAKTLLIQAGFPNGFEVTLDYISTAPYADIAQAVQANLAAIGIKATLLAGEQKQVITKTRGRQHQMALLVWGSDYFDPNSNAQAFCYNPDNGDSPKLKTLAWRSSWQDAELTKMVTENVKELDTEKRIGIYEKMQQIHQDRSPFAFILQQQEVATMGKGVSGFKVGPMSDLTDYAPITKT